MLTLHTNDKNILKRSRIQGTLLIHWSSPGCISLTLLVAFSMSPWAVLNCSVWRSLELLDPVSRARGRLCSVTLMNPFLLMQHWPDGLWSSQESLPKAAAAVLKDPGPPQCPVLQSHPLLSAGTACPYLLLVPCPHSPGVQGRGEQMDLAMGLRELLSPCV